MQHIYVAFYKGPGTWKRSVPKLLGRIQLWVVRKATRSQYTHCELVRSDCAPGCGMTAECLSASGRDRGVHRRNITFKPGHWDFVHVPWAPESAWETASREEGKAYDHKAMLWTFFFAFNREDPERWFCSELVGHALGWKMPHTHSPGSLYRALKANEAVWRAGIVRGVQQSAEIRRRRRPDDLPDGPPDGGPAPPVEVQQHTAAE